MLTRRQKYAIGRILREIHAQSRKVSPKDRSEWLAAVTDRTALLYLRWQDRKAGK